MQPILISVGRGRAARRGFTMVELLVALVLLGLVSAALYRVLVNNQRLYMAQTQRIDLSQNIRAAANILPAELREIDASEGDIVSMTPTRLEIRAMRWLGFACVQPAMGGVLTPITMVIRGGTPGQPLFFGARGINIATDTMLIYYDGDPTSRNDDYWARGEFTGVAPAAVNCPDPIVPPQPGRLVTFNLKLLGLGVNQSGAIPIGAPVRGYEHVIYQLYQPAGDTSFYVGFQPAGGTMQPLIGPVLTNGLTFQYFNANGVVTAVASQVARVDITVRARTVSAVRRGGMAAAATIVDSITTSVALRNNRRF
ncbi:MAG TPA: prepilin-type N-terminal cleavage/methylation domain-containing protein [Gemmatimonadales bacterium]|nr:prepilin-type N-terminal cleavage/methylation domain-containing protein [Gemmatimonadales bacterium]